MMNNLKEAKGLRRCLPVCHVRCAPFSIFTTQHNRHVQQVILKESLINYFLLRGCVVSLCVASYVCYSISSSLNILCNNTSLGRVFHLLPREVNVCTCVCVFVCVCVCLCVCVSVRHCNTSVLSR